MKRLMPRAVALEALAPLVPDSKLALQLLEYWLRRRQQEGGPLLARIWFEQPWKVGEAHAAQQQQPRVSVRAWSLLLYLAMLYVVLLATWSTVTHQTTPLSQFYLP
jgi:hypothetical protein